MPSCRLPGAARLARVDVALAAGVLVVLVAAMLADRRSIGDRPADALAYAIAVALAALTLFARRWPVGVLVLTSVGLIGYYALAYPPVGLAVPVAAGLYAVSEAGRWRFAAAWAGVLLVVTSAFRITVGQDAAFIVGLDLPTSAAVVGGAVAVGDAVHSRRELRAEQARALAAVRREEEHAAAQRVEQERLRLARDLHDVLAHTVSVVSIHADVAEEAVEDGEPAQVGAAVRAIREASSEAMRDLRGTLRVLRGDDPEVLAPVAGLSSLGDLADRARAAGLAVEENVTAVRVPASTGLTAYRVVQEALTNVLRHAAASTVQVRVFARDGVLHVQVDDDGRGADRVREGHGLRGMAERVALVGGRVEAGNRPGGGFRVSARIPT